MNTCGFEKQKNLYLDGELSGAKLAAFEAHLQQCPECREELEQYRGLLDALKDLPERDVPPALQDRLHAALSQEILKGDGRVKRKFNPWALSAVAAAVVVFVCVGALAAGGMFGANKSADENLRLQNYTGGKGADYYGVASSPGDAAENGNGGNGYAAPTMAPAAPAVEAPSFTEKDGGESRSAGNADKGVTATGDMLTKSDEGRKIIYTANLVVETREYDKCIDTVKSLLKKYEGYQEGSQLNGVPDDSAKTVGRSAVISIRVPIGSYESAMGDLAAMGNVLTRRENTEDVSRQYVDTDTRNKTLKAQRDRYMALLEKADTTESIIALQTEITRLTVEIEQMTAQLNFWDDKVSYSTITVELRELITLKTVKPVDPDLNDRMGGALNSTLSDMKQGMEDFAVAFVGFLPWLAILLAVAGVLAAILIPTALRAHKRRALAAGQKEEHHENTEK